MNTVRLVYQGGADLWFRDGSGTKRQAVRGVPFETDEATAGVLMRDPAVKRAGAAAAASVVAIVTDGPVELEHMTATDLRILAASLGIKPKARDTNAAVITAIRAAQAALPESEPEATTSVEEEVAEGQTDEGEDEASAESEPEAAGSITLQDLPASGRITTG